MQLYLMLLLVGGRSIVRYVGMGHVNTHFKMHSNGLQQSVACNRHSSQYICDS